MAEYTLFGAHLSPYVRKVRLALAYKQLSYKQIQVIPFSPDQPQEFKDNSPLGKIPLFKVDDQYISGSSVIISFLERESKANALIPADNIQAAKALWFEEYADSRIVSVVGGHLFAEKILAPIFFKRASNQEEINLAINTELPEIFTYLESQLNNEYLVGNQLTIADIAVCGAFVSMMHCDVFCDGGKWPKVAAYIDRVTGEENFKKIIMEEKMMLKQITGG